MRALDNLQQIGLSKAASLLNLHTSIPIVPLLNEVSRRYRDAILGIDLGTTNSCVAILSDNKPVVVMNEKGNKTTPSIVSFVGQKIRVGEDAKKEEILNHALTISSSKRLMGKKCTDPEVVEHSKSAGYKIVPHTNGDAWVQVENKKYSPQEIGAEILKYLKASVEGFLGHEVKKAVITVPAYFTDAQRKATKTAGELAGLEVLRVINEPTAAALSYGIDTSKNGIVAVYDLGGGTFDVSILEIKDGVFEVKATNGNNHLGGEDFDQAIAASLTDTLIKNTGYNPRSNALAMQRIKNAAEKAKCALSSQPETQINIPYLAETKTGPVHLTTTLTREHMEMLFAPLIQKTLKPCKSAMVDANIKKGEIDHVVVVGGMTRVPSIRKAVELVFGKRPIDGVNPDEAIATGAAIQGGILSGHMSDLLLIDVAPLSLGIETLGGVFSKIIEKNTSIPAKKTQVFTTSEDGQTSVNIKIYQGERPLVLHNKQLGEIVLSGIPPLPKNTPKIEVTFEADANGMYTVTAKDKESKAARNIRIEPSGGLTKEEVERIVKDAEENKIKDEQEKLLIETKARAQEYLVKHAEIKERLKSSIPSAEIQKLSTLAAALTAQISTPTTTKEAIEELLNKLRVQSGIAWSHK